MEKWAAAGNKDTELGVKMAACEGVRIVGPAYFV
jgi:hypothetical protein